MEYKDRPSITIEVGDLGGTLSDIAGKMHGASVMSHHLFLLTEGKIRNPSSTFGKSAGSLHRLYPDPSATCGHPSPLWILTVMPAMHSSLEPLNHRRHLCGACGPGDYRRDPPGHTERVDGIFCARSGGWPGVPVGSPHLMTLTPLGSPHDNPHGSPCLKWLCCNPSSTMPPLTTAPVGCAMPPLTPCPPRM